MIYKKFLQYDESDCAAAALSTVLSRFKNKVSLHEIKKRMNKGSYGSSIQDIIDTSRLFGLEAEGLEGNFEELANALKSKEVKFPFIAHINKNEEFSHFIVVQKIFNNKIFIFDPSSGSKKLTITDFVKIWTGYIVSFYEASQKYKIYAKTNIKDTIKLVYPYRKSLYIGSFLILIVSLLSILGSKAYQIIIDNFIPLGETGSLTVFNTILLKKGTFFILLVSFYIFKNILSYITSNLLTKIDIKIQKMLRWEFFEKFLSLPSHFIKSKKVGESLTRLDDINSLSIFISKVITTFLSNMIMIVVLGVTMLSIRVDLFIIVLISSTLYLITTLYMIPKFSQKQREMMEYEASVLTKFSECIDIFELVKTEMLEDNYEDKLNKTTKKLMNIRKIANILENRFNFIINNIQELGMLCILCLGISLIQSNKLTLGNLIIFQNLTEMFLSSMTSLFILQKEHQQFIVSFERLLEYKEVEPENYGKTLKLDNYNIKIKNLTFSYNNKNLLKNVSVEFQEGDKVFIKGSNGSGKSTFVKLLNKLIVDYQGDIYLGNNNYNNLSVNTVRKKIGFSSSENKVFSGTLYDNLMVFKPTDEKIRLLYEIVKDGILNNLLQTMDYGFDTVLYENGSNLSEGQKQIISFCRTLLSSKNILIFDEGFSNIDSDTEEKLLQFIFKKFKNKTILFIDHGKKVADKCDYVLDIVTSKMTKNN